jgi:hypothetical protein
MTDVIDQVAPILEPVVEPTTPATEAPEEKQVTMTQAQLDALIKSRQAASLRKAATAEAEVARLKAITVGNSEDASTVEKLRAEIALEQQRASAAEARAAAQEKSVLLSRLGSGIDAVDPESVGKLLSDRIAMRDGKPVVLDESGAEQVNPDGSAVSPEQLYSSWAASHAWAIRGRTITGTGQTSSAGSGNSIPPPSIPLERLFGPKSDGKLINQIAITDNARFQRLRAEAKRKGLI